MTGWTYINYLNKARQRESGRAKRLELGANARGKRNIVVEVK